MNIAIINSSKENPAWIDDLRFAICDPAFAGREVFRADDRPLSIDR